MAHRSRSATEFDFAGGTLHSLAAAVQRLDHDLRAERLQHPSRCDRGSARAARYGSSPAHSTLPAATQTSPAPMRPATSCSIQIGWRGAFQGPAASTRLRAPRIRHRTGSRASSDAPSSDRPRSDASPVNTALIAVVATAPIMRREPVPLLPKSRTSSGSDQPPTAPAPNPPHSIAIAQHIRAQGRSTAFAVLRTSSASSRPVNPHLAHGRRRPRIQGAVGNRFVAGNGRGSRQTPGAAGDLRGLKVREPYIYRSPKTSL